MNRTQRKETIRDMADIQLHERAEDLSQETLEMHRAVVSLIEELEAVDWYGQRVDASKDEELKKILVHNRDEEKEHACMTLEWIRRNDAVFNRYLKQYLFQSDSITQVERQAGDTREEPMLGIGCLRTLRPNKEENQA
jgi:ferritin-like protein